MWELDYKASWVLKNWCFWTVVLGKTLESPLDCKEIQPVHPKGNQSWIFIGRTDAKAVSSILWPPNAENWLIEKDPDTGKNWRREEKEMTEEEIVGWHHQLDGHEFEQALGIGDGQGSLLCCNPLLGLQRVGHDLVNWTELNVVWGILDCVYTVYFKNREDRAFNYIWEKGYYINSYISICRKNNFMENWG